MQQRVQRPGSDLLVQRRHQGEELLPQVGRLLGSLLRRMVSTSRAWQLIWNAVSYHAAMQPQPTLIAFPGTAPPLLQRLGLLRHGMHVREGQEILGS